MLHGSPTAAVRTLDALPGCEVGLWEITEGAARDTEVDEVFVVVAGSAPATFEDGERLDLGAGVVVRLRAGERTEWTVTETLRKIWFCRRASSSTIDGQAFPSVAIRGSSTFGACE